MLNPFSILVRTFIGSGGMSSIVQWLAGLALFLALAGQLGGLPAAAVIAATLALPFVVIGLTLIGVASGAGAHIWSKWQDTCYRADARQMLSAGIGLIRPGSRQARRRVLLSSVQPRRWASAAVPDRPPLALDVSVLSFSVLMMLACSPGYFDYTRLPLGLLQSPVYITLVETLERISALVFLGHPVLQLSIASALPVRGCEEDGPKGIGGLALWLMVLGLWAASEAIPSNPRFYPDPRRDGLLLLLTFGTLWHYGCVRQSLTCTVLRDRSGAVTKPRDTRRTATGGCPGAVAAADDSWQVTAVPRQPTK